MPLRIGLIAYPAFAFALWFARPNAIAEYEKAGAYTPETSRRPESLGVRRKAIYKAIARGLLVRAENDRFYIDREAARRADRRFTAFLVLSLVFLAGVMYLLL